MIPKSKEEFIKIFKSRSIILSPITDPAKAAGNLHKSIIGIDAIRHELSIRNARGVDGQGRFRGRLEELRAARKKAKQSWEYASENIFMGSHSKPIGEWAEKINRIDAQLDVCSEECRILNSMIDKWEAEEKIRLEKMNKNSARVQLAKRRAKHAAEATAKKKKKVPVEPLPVFEGV